MENMTLFDVPFFSGTAAQALEEVMSALEEHHSTPFVVFSANTEQVMLARHNSSFLLALQESNLNLPDSVGVVWAGKQLRLASVPRERIPGREFALDIISVLAKKNRSVFLLGGSSDTAKRAAKKLRLQFPNLKVEWSSGAADIDRETPEERTELLERIRAANPDVILVAFGAPAQEQWILANKKMLGEAKVKVAMAVGGTLDLLAGNLHPVPQSIASAHLEWLWRLAQEPWRIKRQLALPQFVLEVLKAKNPVHQ